MPARSNVSPEMMNEALRIYERLRDNPYLMLEAVLAMALGTSSQIEQPYSDEIQTRARAICVEAGEDPDQMVYPGITMPAGYTKPCGPPKPWWMFKADELKRQL